jgi:hypothetical protein
VNEILDSGTPRAELHEASLRLLELCWERNTDQFVTVDRDVLIEHGYGDAVEMVVSMVEEPCGTRYHPEFPDRTLDTEIVVDKLQDPVVTDDEVPDDDDWLEGMPYEGQGDPDLPVQSHKVIRIPERPGEALQAKSTVADLEKVPIEHEVPDEEAALLLRVLEEQLRINRHLYGDDVAQELYGIRADQLQLYRLRHAANTLLTASTELVLPGASYKERGVIWGTGESEPYRHRVYDNDLISRSNPATVVELAVAGPIEIKNMYEYQVLGLGATVAGLLQISFPHSGGGQRTVQLRDGTMSALKIARVDGPVPRLESDPGVDQGRHLTARECGHMITLLKGLYRQYQ